MKYEPFTYMLSYDFFANDSLLSIVFGEYQMACCGASGSSDISVAINADLRKHCFLTLGSIIRPANIYEFDSLVRVNYHPQQSDDSIQFTFDSSSTAFSFSSVGVSIHIECDGGGHSWTEFSFIPFEGHRNIFQEYFLRGVEPVASKLKHLK